MAEAKASEQTSEASATREHMSVVGTEDSSSTVLGGANGNPETGVDGDCKTTGEQIAETGERIEEGSAALSGANGDEQEIITGDEQEIITRVVGDSQTATVSTVLLSDNPVSDITLQVDPRLEFSEILAENRVGEELIMCGSK